MKIIEYFSTDNKEYWLSKIKESDWGAGQFLYDLLKNQKLKPYVGENTKVLLLVDGENLISFCTFADKDDIHPNYNRILQLVPGSLRYHFHRLNRNHSLRGIKNCPNDF